MKTSVLLLIVAFSARYTVKVAEAHCGLGGCKCSAEPEGTCCPGYTCGRESRCVEIVPIRDEFVYPYPYDFNNYGYTESGVPGYEARYDPISGYVGGSTAFGNNFVGTEYGVGRVPYSPFFFAGF
ncbi:uncharacterized protein LOC129004404 [Macrosteles quadrilineatus]|uniref:uncharacterized protein LOC129004404 n=1 Tax=Macrosteles quadrilineatus TaxID=74068 RepID=UPI0023E33515|nr:uncharacterized protein LOC129004404 [Macrosteles quadrilineatus]